MGVVGFIISTFGTPKMTVFYRFPLVKRPKGSKKIPARFARRKILGRVGFIISNSQTNLKPVGFIRGGAFINIRTVVSLCPALKVSAIVS